MVDRSKRPPDANQLAKRITDLAIGQVSDARPTPEQGAKALPRFRPIGARAKGRWSASREADASGRREIAQAAAHKRCAQKDLSTPAR
jgi:hypothetical protein